MTGSTPRRGRLVVLAAPSGAGKTTLVHALLARRPDLKFSVSYTTRQKRKSEAEGRDYFFIDERRFKEMVDRDEFLEYARVFDHWYGTGRRHVEELLASGRDVLLEIDWQGARQVRARTPDALTVFILPPSVEALETRLRSRGTDSAEVVARRLRDALGDLSHWHEFDYVVVNDDLERATRDLEDIVAGRGDRHRADGPAAKAAAERILGPARGV